MSHVLRILVAVALVSLPMIALPIVASTSEESKEFFENLEDKFDKLDQPCSVAARKLAEGPNVFERKKLLKTMQHCLERNSDRLRTKLENTASKEEANAEVVRAEQFVATRQEVNRADVKFQGLSWGVGFGISYAIHEPIINEAEVANGRIRSIKNETQQVRILLETHRYFRCGDKSAEGATFGFGPAGFVTTGQDDALAGVGAGFMLGWKAPDSTKGTGLSLGFGFLLDNDVRSLADGFEKTHPLPPGETAIRFESKARWSGVVFFTRTF